MKSLVILVALYVAAKAASLDDSASVADEPHARDKRATTLPCLSVSVADFIKNVGDI
jgi:hypothetical protein